MTLVELPGVEENLQTCAHDGPRVAGAQTTVGQQHLTRTAALTHWCKQTRRSDLPGTKKKKQLSQTLHRTSSFRSPHYFESYYAVILTFLFRAAMQRDRIGPTTGPYSVTHKIPFKLKHYFTPASFPTSWCRFNASACLQHIP